MAWAAWLNDPDACDYIAKEYPHDRNYITTYASVRQEYN